MKRLVSLIFFCLLPACSWQGQGPANPGNSEPRGASRIFGGLEVAKGSWRAASSVMITGEDDKGVAFICTGTFIAEDLILTAAHCVGADLELMNLIFDVDPFNSEDLVTRSVKRSWVFDGALQNPKDRKDVAILQFEGGLPHGARIARLAEADKIVGPNLDFQALGYGRTTGLNPDDTDAAGSGRLRLAALESRDMAPERPDFTVDQSDGKGVCYGDSGGAAYSVLTRDESVVVGIASGVFDPSENKKLNDVCTGKSIYMNVIFYRKWISSIIEEAHIVDDENVRAQGVLSMLPHGSSSTLSKPAPSNP